MQKLCAILLVLAFFAGPAEAHRDRILHVKTDGSIPDVPAAFGPVRLIVEGLGSEKPLIQLKIGTNQTTLPFCVSRMIRTKNVAEIQVTGSWDHDEQHSLPYYLNIQFYNPGYDQKRGYNSNHEFLFDLHNAKLIHATAFVANQSGNGGQGKALKLPPGCKLNQNS